MVVLPSLQTLAKDVPVAELVTPFLRQLTAIPPPVLLHRAVLLPVIHILVTRTWASASQPATILLKAEFLVNTDRAPRSPGVLVPSLTIISATVAPSFRPKFRRVQFSLAVAVVRPTRSTMWSVLMLAPTQPLLVV